MFEWISSGYAVNDMEGSMRLCYMLSALWFTVVVAHYFAVFGYQWINDVEAEYGSRWLLFRRYGNFTDDDVVTYVGFTAIGLMIVPLVLAFLLAAILTIPWLFAIIIAVLCSMKLTRGVVRLKKKLNKHINDNDAHKES